MNLAETIRTTVVVHGFDWGLDLDLKSFLRTGFLTGLEGKIWIWFKSNILDWILDFFQPLMLVNHDFEACSITFSLKFWIKVHWKKNLHCRNCSLCDGSVIYHRFDTLRRPILRVYARSRGRTSGKCPFVAKA